jgi:hypothetical protein
MVSLQATEFTDMPTKLTTYGFRMWDDYGSSWVGGMKKDQVPSNDLDLLAMAVRQAQIDEAILAMLVAVADCKNSIFVNGKEYIWDVIAPILASGGKEVPEAEVVKAEEESLTSPSSPDTLVPSEPTASK